jgi:hypothetical protein
MEVSVSSNNELAEVLAGRVWGFIVQDHSGDTASIGVEDAVDLCEMVLDSPEIRAIRQFVQEVRATNEGYDHLLPQPIIDWVLSDE